MASHERVSFAEANGMKRRASKREEKNALTGGWLALVDRLYDRNASHLHRCVAAAKVLRRHAHAGSVNGRWGCRTVRSASWAGVVLGTSPAKTNARVANRVALHLVDGHLRCVTLHELDESASLAWRDLHVGDLAEALEERAELVLGDVAGQAANEHSGVVGVGELVHGLGSAVVAHRRGAHGVHTHARAAATLLHTAHTTGAARTAALVLGSRGADAHGSVAAVDALHLGKGLLLVVLAREAHEAVAARHSGDGIGHYLRGLGGCVPVLEQLDEDKLGHLGAKVTHEDGILGTALIAAISAY
jgi:hypothetical protein